MARPPDSRATVGQKIEDELDAISDAMRRQTRDWIQRMRRGQPGVGVHSAIIGGIAAALLDELWETGDGQPEPFSRVWGGFAQNYLEAVQDDAAANAEENPK